MDHLDLLIANNIKDLRKKHGYTQSDLANKLGYTVQAISRWEKGKSLPDPVMLYKVAELFDVDISYFYQQNHIEIDEEQEREIKRRETIFKIVLFLVSMFIIGVLVLTIIFLIDVSSTNIVLWILSFLSIATLGLGIYLRNDRIINIFIPIVVLTISTTLYFSLHKDIPEIKYIFIPMVVIIVLFLLFLLLINRRKR
ncbi:MAG: helix-turn-helix transcriptional regulator [Erysipelotrichaceae bacterium]|nr:helix-turn-helix transcriptional regulator [Erysipelotrichaceae bacterium]